MAVSANLFAFWMYGQDKARLKTIQDKHLTIDQLTKVWKANIPVKEYLPEFKNLIKQDKTRQAIDKQLTKVWKADIPMKEYVPEF